MNRMHLAFLASALALIIAMNGCTNASGLSDDGFDMVRRAEANATKPTSEGKLGYPLGTYLTIEGVRMRPYSQYHNLLKVDKVGDKSLRKPIYITVGNIPYIPIDERCVIRGYESGMMVGLPAEVWKAEDITISQTIWQFERYFIMTSAVTPTNFPEIKYIQHWTPDYSK